MTAGFLFCVVIVAMFVGLFVLVPLVALLEWISDGLAVRGPAARRRYRELMGPDAPIKPWWRH